tara:strand:- start:74 stop:334 length:261 start_codon:yes stop_codon:yes gene_type:complete
MTPEQKTLLREYATHELGKVGLHAEPQALFNYVMEFLDKPLTEQEAALREFAAKRYNELAAARESKLNVEIPALDADIAFYKGESE